MIFHEPDNQYSVFDRFSETDYVWYNQILIDIRDNTVRHFLRINHKRNIFKDTYGPKGANLTLDCEARGFPAPSISWQFETVEGETIFLPSDDQAISIQMRGGPEANMVTGWAQILALEPGYSGVYHCIAENTQVNKMRSRYILLADI